MVEYMCTYIASQNKQAVDAHASDLVDGMRHSFSFCGFLQIRPPPK